MSAGDKYSWMVHWLADIVWWLGGPVAGICPPGSPIVQEALQLTDILGNPIGPSLPPWCEAALSGTPSNNTFGPSTCSLPTVPPKMFQMFWMF